MADTQIAEGDTSRALSTLKQAEKKAHTSYERLGVFKRYSLLGEDKKAEKVIKKALKKEKDNTQVRAVYVRFLLRLNRAQEALNASEKLQGTPYGSLYAEAFLNRAVLSDLTAEELFAQGKKRAKKDRHILQDEREASRVDLFYDVRFGTVYQEAFNGTHIPLWAMNAAILDMMSGNYADAASRFPSYADTEREALFWGEVLYDAGLYAESLAVLLSVDSSLAARKDEELEHNALIADDYYILGEDEASENLRASLLNNAESYTGQRAALLLPLLYVNSALYAHNNDDMLTEYKRLYAAVEQFPQYEPALAAYGDFALSLLRRPPDDKMTAHIRASGLQTRQMEAEAEIPDVPLKDVLAIIERSRLLHDSPKLIVLEESLKAEENGASDGAKRVARVWPLLEKNEISSSLYPQEIMQYAVLLMLSNGAQKEAEDTFSRYMQAAYGSAEKTFVPSEHVDMLSLWECEVAAWFAVQNNRISEAVTLYKHIADLYSKRNPVMNASGQNTSVLNSYMNLANIYSGTGQARLALDYLNKASARALDSDLKAEIMYRMGKEQYYLGDYYTAMRSLQYAIKLNPNHNKARLVLKLVQQAQNER